MLNFLRKLFKALNSSGKPWQLSAAVILAMFTGFLPSNSLILFDLFLIALVLNINFGLFLLFTVIFSGIGYLFDPLFESIGYTVLTNEGLNGFFTALYNSVVFRWSAFNHTLVTGSLIVSTLLALPMLLILNRVVALYRVQIGKRLNEWKLTKWMNLFNEEAQSTSLFRWWGLGVFGGLSALIIFVLVFIFDPLARIALEKSLSYSLQTQVDIENFSSSLSDLSVKISGLEVADKDKLSHNLVQVQEIQFDLGFSALIEKKIMIEDLDINRLVVDEQRKVPAKPYGDVEKQEMSQAEIKADTKEKEGVASPFSLPDVDDILAKEELVSISQAKELKADIEKTKLKWKTISEGLKRANDVEDIKAEAKKLEKSLKDADITKIASAKHDIDMLKSKIKNLKSQYSNLQKDFVSDQARLKKQLIALKGLPQKDIDRLKSKYSMGTGGGGDVISALINKELGTYITKVLKYYEMLKPYLNDSDAKVAQESTPPRGQGRWIKYANHSRIPEFLIKEGRINLLVQDEVIDIKLNHLSSNQKLYGKAMTLHVDAKGEQYRHLIADVIDDRRKEVVSTRFDMNVKELKKSAFDLQTLSMRDMLINAHVIGKLEGSFVKAKSTINVIQAKLQMPSQELVNELLAGISRFNVDIGVNGKLQTPDINVKSDLDKQLSSGLKSMVSKATQGFEKELRAGVMKKVGSSNDGVSADLGDADVLLGSKQDALGGINTSFSPSAGGSNFLKKLF